MSVAQQASQRVATAAADTTFRPEQLLAPGALLFTGTTIHLLSHDPGLDRDVRQFFYVNMRDNGQKRELFFDEWARYAPMVMGVGLGLVGVDAKHCFLDRCIEAGWATVATVAFTRGIKHLVDTPRPNGGSLSFPSGHTSSAFVGAEMVRIEYGNGWGAGAYIMAAGVGSIRLYDDWHWLSDVLTGAGIGILCAHIGEWMIEPTKKLLGIHSDGQFAITPAVDPASGTLCASFAMQF